MDSYHYVKTTTVQAAINKLATLPYSEVGDLVNDLRSCKVALKGDDPKEALNTKQIHDTQGNNV